MMILQQYRDVKPNTPGFLVLWLNILYITNQIILEGQFNTLALLMEQN